jgi:CrcB protein
VNLLLVILGGGIGSGLRYWLSGVVAQRFGESFPWGTLMVNITGSFLIGFFAALTGPGGRVLVPPGFRIFIMAGVFGGYTTFSAFSLQTLNLARGGEWFHAGANALLSFALCLAGVWLGHILGTALNQPKIP